MLLGAGALRNNAFETNFNYYQNKFTPQTSSSLLGAIT